MKDTLTPQMREDLISYRIEKSNSALKEAQINTLLRELKYFFLNFAKRSF